MGKEQQRKLTHYKNGQKTFEQKGFNSSAIAPASVNQL
jgi:hypothetical protein